MSVTATVLMMNSVRSRTVSLCLVLYLLSAPGAALSVDGIDQKKQDLRRIKREMAEKKQKLRKAGRRERSVLGEMEKYDRAIQASNAELAKEQQQLHDAESALAALEKEASGIERDLEEIKRAYGIRIRALYKMGRSGYTVGIFSSGTMTAAVKRMKYLEIIAAQDRDLITEYRSVRERLLSRQREIETRKKEQGRRQQHLRARQADLLERKKEKSEILASVRKEKGLYGQLLEELEESSRNLGALIKKEEAERRRAEEAAARARLPGAAPSAAPVARGRLPWPVNGRVVTPYGRQQHPKFGNIVFRRGIEIEAREGDPVRAVGGGRVAYADWYKGYGKLIILDHGAGLYSLYGYLSRLDVKKGDQAAGGQVIGLTGQTGGGLKGSMLYFEIRRHGEAEDPLPWLARR